MNGIEIYLLVGMVITAISLAAMGDPWKGSRTAFVIATALSVAAWPALIGVALYHVVMKGVRSADKP